MVTIKGRLALDPPREEQVAASLLSIGLNTRAARAFQGLDGERSAACLAERLAIPAADRQSRLDRARAQAQEALRRADAIGATIALARSEDYPEKLAHIYDPPIILWRLGQAPVLDMPAVAIVGSRRPSAGGTATAGRLAGGLARAGFVVVSGLARGIDAAAHRGALRAGGLSVAVLGSGVDVIYPPEHRELAAEVALTGCVVSELPPGTPPRARHFPLRNRLISGLSLAVVVVEAAERSGSLITARMALEQGRSVCAVPGSVVSGCHQGCHALIKDGARLVETVGDVLEELGLSPVRTGQAAARNSSAASGLLAAMRVGEPMGLDQLALATGRSGADLLAELGRLELAGQLDRSIGGSFVRLD